MLKFLAVCWSALWALLVFAPYLGSGAYVLANLGEPVVWQQILENLKLCFMAWVLGLVALAAFKVIFADEDGQQLAGGRND